MRVGIIGAGQLAQMLAMAARTMGISLVVQGPCGDDPAVAAASGWVPGPLGAPEAVQALADQVDVIGFENELVDLAPLRPLEQAGVVFRPSLDTLSTLMDKRRQRHVLQDLNIPVPTWVDLNEALTHPERLHDFDYPLMAKAASGGYDGRGLQTIDDAEALKAFAETVDTEDWYLERFVDFERELAMVGSRSVTGEARCYPLLETRQPGQVCTTVLAPASVPQDVEARAVTIVGSILQQLDYVGVLAVELFLAPEGLLVNELAPRTHNSGHLTIEACATSQFEQHLRALTGTSLGPTHLSTPGAVMVNLLGFEDSRKTYAHEQQALAALPGFHLHWYGKRVSRRGRKLGHVTRCLTGSTPAQRQQAVKESLAAVDRIWPVAQAMA
ncbi:MAG: 5-(carboxyamino)imidazole ribonucleotide synthase [Synechococcus sp. SB0668_bin_15]|nr:5-(carboxyamino)imidazole ribonucleotide synthase [Synechococcus sp. SB0668_bin_15]MYC49608.1 5-(carboxyamino)imidazole ribonucleotide synthase [Synechococcus sp. SB0662_bin_14]